MSFRQSLCFTFFLQSPFFTFVGSKVGAAVRALTSHLGPGFGPSSWHVGWVCCWFCPCSEGFFKGFFKFSSLHKNQHFQMPIRPGRQMFTQNYPTIKKTVNTENIPGMCVLSNHMRDLVTAENEYVLSHGIELFRKTTRFNLHQQEPIRSGIPFYLTAPRTTQAKIGLSAFFSTKRRNDQCFRHFK